MAPIFNTSIGKLLRKHSLRVVFWVATSTALCCVVKSPGWWSVDAPVNPPPEDQQNTSAFDPTGGGWWNGNPSLTSITSLVADYYGEGPQPSAEDELRRAYDELHGTPSGGSGPWKSDLLAALSAQIENSPPVNDDPFASFHSRYPDEHDYFVCGSLCGYMPESGVNLAAASSGLGIVAVPEPGSGLLLISSIACLALRRRRPDGSVKRSDRRMIRAFVPTS